MIKSPGILVLFSVCWLVAAPGAILLSHAAPPTATDVTTQEILREVSKIRQLTIKKPVKSGVQTRAGMERMLNQSASKKSLANQIRASELSLKKLGLVPPGFQMRPFFVKLMTEQIAGYYDPKTKVFYLSEKLSPADQKLIMAHELTHALQDQHFDLGRFQEWPRGDSDAQLAMQALIEGDAMFTESRYLARHRPGLFSILRSMLLAMGNSQEINNAPRALRETLIFPYRQGMTWVSQVFRHGGWPRVSKAYTQLPQSTEQILHVDKYLAREAPVRVNLTNVATKLGAGWKRIDYDINGEWSHYLILDEFLQDKEASQRAAAGWGGDRYAVYEGPRKGDLLFQQLIVWDSQQDAREFFDAYAKRTALRYKNNKVVEVSAGADKGSRRIWRTNEGAVIMERRGSRVMIAEGVPGRIAPAKLITALWK